MVEWLALLVIVVAGLFPGWLLALHLAGSREALPAAPVERVLAALALGLATVGWLAFVLAEIGLFSLVTLGSGWALLTLLLAAGAYRRGLPATKAPAPETAGEVESRSFVGIVLPPWLEYAGLLLWLCAALWLFFRPHQYFLGGADAGVYVNTAVQIAENGQIVIEEPALETLDPDLYPALLRERRAGEGTRYYLFPGFNISDEAPGTVIPDFFHLHPVWQAVAYALGGVQAALLLPGLWALLGTLSVYLTLRQIAGWPVAFLALAGLSLSALQVWFARYPVTESLTQYLLWSGLWALGAWLSERRARSLWGLLAGLTLGQLLLVRIDTVFILGIPLFVALWLLLSARRPRAGFWFFLLLSLLSIHAALHAVFFSRAYAYRIAFYVANMMRRFWYIPLSLLLVGAIGLLLFLRYRPLLVRLWQRYNFVLGAAALLLLLLALYGWFLRPIYGRVNSYVDWYGGQTIVLTDRENLRRLGWYLSPVGVWLGILGALLLVWRLNRKTVAVVGTGLFFSLLYLWRIQATPHQIYAMRRYVPATLPFFIIGAAFFLGWLGRQRALLPRLLSLALTVLWLGGLVWSAQGFVSQVDNEQLWAEVAALDAGLAENAVIIFNDQAPVSLGDLLGTPLHYIYGHDVFTLRAPEKLEAEAFRQQVARWQSEGRIVYWVGDPTQLSELGISSANAGSPTLSFQFLENSYDHKPVRLILTEWVLPLVRVQ